MHYEYFLDRSKLKGYIFEIVISEFLRSNGFHTIDIIDGDKIRRNREDFIEIRGRGTWHQIDCPCDYEGVIPFIYPIRMLAEVKFFSKRIDKKYIREYIGVVKDIQENIFVPDDYVGPFTRFSEIGVFFAANGFDDEAEKLAFAHNIKTISYENNCMLGEIKRIIDELERNYLSTACISRGQSNIFRSLLRSIL